MRRSIIAVVLSLFLFSSAMAQQKGKVLMIVNEDQFRRFQDGTLCERAEARARMLLFLFQGLITQRWFGQV